MTTFVAKAKARESACKVATGCRKASGTRSCVTSLATTFACDTYRPQEEAISLVYLQQEDYRQPLRSKYKVRTREPASAFERPSPLSATHSARLQQSYPPHALKPTAQNEPDLQTTLLPHEGGLATLASNNCSNQQQDGSEGSKNNTKSHSMILVSRDQNSARTKRTRHYRLAGSEYGNKDSKPTTSSIGEPHHTAKQAHTYGGRPQHRRKRQTE